ncbi:MAG: DUF2949 domain-containing protein [Cyanobacteria bacterium CRU_2_1]|nr:DUF2949 domain-containing protein [Cyanobacteria bacterium CRU_2_1]
MSSNTQLIQFLQHELAVSPAEIDLLLRHPEHKYAPLPMLLWQYGLLSLSQLAQVFDWLEAQYDSSPTRIHAT